MEAYMFRKALLLFVLFLTVGVLFAENINATIEINGIIVNGGSIYVAVYSNENDYKAEKPFVKFILDPANSKISHVLELPDGEYVVSVFQDTNSNGDLDTNFFGIPSEPIGKTNYGLRGAPGGFNKLKTPINKNSAKLIVNMGKVKALGVI
jgi:uncharacterized protein (DUF2141 family)